MKEKVGKLPGLLKGKIPPLIAIVGTEDFLKRDALAQILRQQYGDQVPDEDVTKLMGDRSTRPDDLVALFDELRTPSLFGGHRTVVVDRAELFFKVDLEAWAGFLQTPWAGARLILLLEELDGRTKVAKRLGTQGWILTAEKPFNRPPPWMPDAPPWENDLNRWIVQRGQSLGLRIDPPTAHFFQTRVGTSLTDLSQGLTRLATVQSEGGKVTREDVERHTPDGEDSNLFELVDTLFLGDRRRTLRLTREILHRGSSDPKGARVTDPASLLLQFIGGCLRRVRQLREVHRTLADGGDDAALMRNTGTSRPFLPRLKQQARTASPKFLDHLVHELRRADTELKTGQGPLPAELLERIAVRGGHAEPVGTAR